MSDRPDPLADGARAGPPDEAPDEVPDRGFDEASVRAVVEHMNDDHADAVTAYARAFADEDTREWLARTPGASVRMSGIDRHGIDLRCTVAAGEPSTELAAGRAVRVDFPVPLGSAGGARGALVALVRRARELLDPG